MPVTKEEIPSVSAVPGSLIYPLPTTMTMNTSVKRFIKQAYVGHHRNENPKHLDLWLLCYIHCVENVEDVIKERLERITCFERRGKEDAAGVPWATGRLENSLKFWDPHHAAAGSG